MYRSKTIKQVRYHIWNTMGALSVVTHAFWVIARARGVLDVSTPGEFCTKRPTRCQVIADGLWMWLNGHRIIEALADHDKNLRMLMERCKGRGLALNAQKMRLRLREVTYMGHLIMAEGLKIDPEKTKAIRDMPIPVDKAGAQRLLGMVNYVQKFVPRLADITTPLRELTKKDNEFISEEHIHGKALDQVREILSQPPVLRYFDPHVTPVLQCEASLNSLGACLM